MGNDEFAVAVGEVYHTEVVIYLFVGLSILLFLLIVEHTDIVGCPGGQRFHYFTLPLATGLAFGLEKVFNTEIGFIAAPENLPQGFITEPHWTGMGASIGLLGLTDFYLNLRGAQRMPVQVFVPASFAISTSLQYFQSVAIFQEFTHSNFWHTFISICGAIMS